MTRRLGRILLAGCLLLSAATAPAAVRCVHAGWRGAYPIAPAFSASSPANTADTVFGAERSGPTSSDADRLAFRPEQ